MTNEIQPQRRIGRSFGAIVLGMIVGIALTLGTDEVLHVVHVFPPWGASVVGYEGALLLATIYRTIYQVLSSYVTARVAPDRPMGHALTGGFIGLAVAILGAAVTWNKGPALGPHWYPVALLVLALPTAWVGGKIRVMQLNKTAAP